MAANFHQLMIAEHHARAALETAVENFLTAETSLIAENSFLPEVTRMHARDASLALLQLLVDKKLKQLSAPTCAETAYASSSAPPAP